MNSDKVQRVLYVIVGAIVVIAALAAFVNLGQPEPEQISMSQPDAPKQERAAGTSQPKTWHPVTLLSGENAKRGEPFVITGTQQRITYTVSGEYPALYVYLMENGASLERDGGMSQVGGASGDGETIVYALPGTYYLDIIGSGTWSVTVEELR